MITSRALSSRLFWSQLARPNKTSERTMAATKAAQEQASDSKGAVVNQQKSSQMTPNIKDESTEIQELRTDRASFYPDQMEWLDDRLVRISRPTKNVMQQSGYTTKDHWRLEFNSEPRYENWLMGWTSTNDPLSNLVMTFPTKETAIKFCEQNKLQWFVEEQPERKVRLKSYADNYSWNKRTRNGCK